jgi:hypothetical protein
MARCHWHTAGGERFFLPRCFGGAVYGPDGCTCRCHKKSAEQRIYELENRLQELENQLRPKDSIHANSPGK